MTFRLTVNSSQSKLAWRGRKREGGREREGGGREKGGRKGGRKGRRERETEKEREGMTTPTTCIVSSRAGCEFLTHRKQ